MMKFLRQSKIKALDAVVILLLFCLSFIPVFVFASGNTHGTEAILKHNGKVVKVFQLSQNTLYSYDNHGETCEVQIENGRARFKEANCFDKLCVKVGWISKPGQSAVCLPHGNVLSISGNAGPVKEDGKIVDYQG